MTAPLTAAERERERERGRERGRKDVVAGRGREEEGPKSWGKRESGGIWLAVIAIVVPSGVVVAAPLAY